MFRAHPAREPRYDPAVLKKLGVGVKKSIAFAIIIATIGGLLSLMGWGIAGIANSNDHDYAGYGPQSINDHALTAVSTWYGLKSAPSKLSILSKEHSSAYGQRAWKITYLTPALKKICVWVWGEGKTVPGAHYGPDDFWLLKAGKACG